MGKIKIIKVGMMATIQDEGRFGYRQYGIPYAGAMDRMSFHQANELVGNPVTYPVIEIILQGIEIEAFEPTVVGLCGAEGTVFVNDQKTGWNESISLSKGDKLKITPSKKGVYSYLGVGGKIQATEDFGSVSTYLMAGFGGIDGHDLKKGVMVVSKGGPKSRSGKIQEYRTSKFPTNPIIRYLEGPESALVKYTIEGKSYKIHQSSNRMGIRLDGEQADSVEVEMLSSAVVPGVIQLPPGGTPIILMNDCQTTGGYPRIGKVIDADLGRLAQVRAGQQIKFKRVSLEEAIALQERVL